jgi:hypothetical protein
VAYILVIIFGKAKSMLIGRNSTIALEFVSLGMRVILAWLMRHKSSLL